MSEEISTEAAVKRRRLISRGRNLSKADIYECDYEGRTAILKDYGRRNILIRSTMGRWCAKREFVIYQELKGLAGIPQCFLRPDPFSFILEFIDGHPLSEISSGRLLPSLFPSLRSIIKDIHSRGIACGDIHHRDVLITSDGKPILIDFVTGWKKGGRLNIMRNLIFKWLCALDWLAFYRIRQRYTGTVPSDDEKKDFSYIIGLYHAGRLLKWIWDCMRGRA